PACRTRPGGGRGSSYDDHSVAVIMATRSCRENRKMYWDHTRRRSRPATFGVTIDRSSEAGKESRVRPRWLLAMMVCASAILPAQTRVDNSRAMDSILVKDWVPDSSLVVPETNIVKARFPAIDVHVHARGNLGDTRESLSAWVQTMDEAGVEKMIVLSEATGAEFDRLADLYQKNYPDRFQLWCGLDEQEFEKPDYPERAAAELDRCYRKGGRG